MGTNKKSSLKMLGTNAYFLRMAKNTDKVVFHQIKVIDAGAKGISSKGPDGKVVFIPNVVPGDVIDVQTFKSASLIMKEKQFIFMNIQNTVPNLYEHFGVCVAKWQNMKYSQQLYYKQNEVYHW
jgi:23S rRNA (uracil1939-C5)-methyltransferase